MEFRQLGGTGSAHEVREERREAAEREAKEAEERARRAKEVKRLAGQQRQQQQAANNSKLGSGWVDGRINEHIKNDHEVLHSALGEVISNKRAGRRKENQRRRAETTRAFEAKLTPGGAPADAARRVAGSEG